MHPTKSMRFSMELPENCPPSLSIPTSGEVFRIVGNDPPTESDFRTHRELYPKKKVSNECNACGLSVYRDKSDIRRMIRRIPSRRKHTQLIALGNLNENMGMIVHNSCNGDSHHTWWMAFGCRAWEVFAVIEIVSPNQA